MPNEKGKIGVEPFEESGHWWLSGTAKKVRGDLSRDEKGDVRLKFGGDSSTIPAWNLQNPSIVGELDWGGSSGRKVTLLHTFGQPEFICHAPILGTDSIRHVTQITCYANGYLQGNIHLENQKDTRFSSLRFIIAEDSGWLGVYSSRKNEGDYLVIRVPNHQNRFRYERDGIKVTFSANPFVQPIGMPGISGTQYTTRDRILVEMEFKDAIHLEELIKFSFMVKDFFRLVMHNSISLEAVRVSNVEIKRLSQSGQVVDYMDLYYRQLFSSLDHDDALDIVRLTHADIKENFENLMFSWIQHYNEMMPILDHYFGLFGNIDLPDIIQFQILIQGMEAFCKRDKEFLKILNSSRPCLRKKIEIFTAPFRGNFCLPDDEIPLDWDLLIEKMVAIRNDWVHEATIHEKAEFALGVINNFLKRLFRLNIWRWMGMDMQKISWEMATQDSIFTNREIRLIMSILPDIPSPCRSGSGKTGGGK